MQWRQVFDGRAWNGPTAELYNPSGIPFTMLIGRDGKISALGARGDRLRYAIEQAIYGERTMPNEQELRGMTRLPAVTEPAPGG
jgi:hypothetical protein